MSSQNRPISIIITTYNWPRALSYMLMNLNMQTNNNFEVIIADDGSSQDTANMLNKIKKKLSFPITHVWQEDKGFRAAKIRNKAIAKSSGDYLIFLDHDCIPRKNFIEKQLLLSEKRFFVSGSRIFLTEEFTEHLINNNIYLADKSCIYFLKCRMQSKCNRFTPMLTLPLGMFRKLYKNSWKGTKNLIAVWKQDLININGYNENFTGWGYEDTEMVIRLLYSGIQRKIGRFSTEVVHLYHPSESRDRASKNLARLESTAINGNIKFPGLEQYL